VVSYTPADQDGCTAPLLSVCAVTDKIGKPSGLTMVEECLT